MKERPIIFGSEMVRAILADRKTQTRRVAKNVEHDRLFRSGWKAIHRDKRTATCISAPSGLLSDACPYGKPGDRLWVRETCTAIDQGREQEAYLYAADRIIVRPGVDGDPGRPWEYHARYDRPTVPSTHMPRCASRITLEIVSVRVEQLQDISTDDILAEGVTVPCDKAGRLLIDVSSSHNPARFGARTNDTESIIRGYWASLWASIYGEESWNATPWVWVIEFCRVDERLEGTHEG